MNKIPIALTIAGSDSSGGAGIQADLKSFSANRVYGASVITALTAQNTKGVSGIHDVPAEFIADQLDAVFSDLKVDAVKIGMLSQVAVIETVANALEKHKAKNIVLDPVMVATSGDMLLVEEAVEAVEKTLMPLADLVTPNLFESARLTGQPPAQNKNAMEEQGQALRAAGAQSVLVKGGHYEGSQSIDLLVTENGSTFYAAERIDTSNTHGTGCSLSSAIAAELAHGNALETAIGRAKKWLTGAIANSDQLEIGQGSGPVHHFHELWRN
ncbi:MAG: bifunctional hydroxymethylpyrimidine kinase/phosphomethylpyrimidine kinase [Pseudomonadota bacterium]